MGRKEAAIPRRATGGRTSVSQAGCCPLSQHGQQRPVLTAGPCRKLKLRSKVQQSRRDLAGWMTQVGVSCVAAGAPMRTGVGKHRQGQCLVQSGGQSADLGSGDAFLVDGRK